MVTRPTRSGSRAVASHRCQASSRGQDRSRNSAAACCSAAGRSAAASRIRATAIACTGGWQIPDVRGSSGASAESSAQPHRSAPGKYWSASGEKTMCGSMPLRHCARSRVSSSRMARGTLTDDSPIAMKQASQLHMCG